MKYKNLILLGVLIPVLLVFLPVIIYVFIFQNSIKSGIDNSDWASFLGSYIGGVLGALIAGIVTLFGVKFTIDFSHKESKEDRQENRERDLENQIKNIMPFLQLSINGAGGSFENGYKLNNFSNLSGDNSQWRIQSYFKNIGRDSAVNIECSLENVTGKGTQGKKNIFFNDRGIRVGDSSRGISFFLDGFKNGNNLYSFEVIFEDLMGNMYLQEFNIEIDNELSFDKIKYFSKRPMLLSRHKE